MEILDFVIDSELFSLFSSTNKNLELIKCQFRGELLYEDETITDAKSFHEVLKNMKKYKCKIVRNEPIKQDYLRIIESCDETVKKKFMRMIATQSYWNYTDETFTEENKKEFEGSVLERKTHYVDAARQCKDYSVIVTTAEHKNEYKRDGKLRRFRVNCDPIHNFEETLKEINSSSLLKNVNNGNKEENKLEFVIDSEVILLLNSMHNRTKFSQQYPKEEILNKEDEGIEEFECLYNIFDEIINGNCVIAINNEINTEYSNMFNNPNCNTDVLEMFDKILSVKSRYSNKDKELTDRDRRDREIFNGTVLEGKTHYIDAAKECSDYRVIISTKKCTNEYLKQYRKLLELEVNCESICEFNNSLERELHEDVIQKEVMKTLKFLKENETNSDTDESLFKRVIDSITLNFLFISLEPGKMLEIVKLYRKKSKKSS